MTSPHFRAIALVGVLGAIRLWAVLSPPKPLPEPPAPSPASVYQARVALCGPIDGNDLAPMPFLKT